MPRFTALALMLSLAACQAAPPARVVPAHPIAPVAAHPPEAAQAAPPAGPSERSGSPDRLLPGRSRRFEAPAGSHRLIVVSNATGHGASLACAVDRPGDGLPPATPTAGPGDASAVPEASPDGASPAPSPDPSATAPGATDVLAPPFGRGFGMVFDGPAPARPPITSRGLAQAPAQAAVLAVGARVPFWINNGDTTLAGDASRACRLAKVSAHAYFFVDEQATLSDATVQKFLEAFEQNIRPGLAPVFGSESEPGITGADRLFVVFSPWIGQAPGRSGMMGYFWPRDPVRRSGSGDDVRQHANEKQVLFLSTALANQPDVTALGTLAHEYQHLVMYDAKTRVDGTPRTEDTWLDEGFSMLAMDLAGYGLAHGDPFVGDEIAAWERAPARYSLTEWASNPNGYAYGLSYMFARYLLDRFGPGLVADVQHSALTGTKGLDAALNRRNTSLEAVFVQFTAALAPAASPGPAPGFGWFDPAGSYGDMKLPGVQTAPLTAPQAIALKPWGSSYVAFDGLASGSRSLTLGGAGAPLALWDSTERGAP